MQHRYTQVEAQEMAYTPPPVKPGTVVMFWHSGQQWSGSPGEPALVLRAPPGERTLAVQLLGPSAVTREYLGVRHIEDPMSYAASISPYTGFWDYTDSHKEFMRLQEQVRKLAALVEAADMSGAAAMAEKIKELTAKCDEAVACVKEIKEQLS